MKRILVLVATILIVGLNSGTHFAQSGYDLFQKALVKERAEGNLDEAIKLYQRIVAEYSSNRALTAKALIELGQCYEKLGKDEARKAYERVLRDYADQNEAATEARTRLAALSGNGASKASEMVTRRVWAGPDVDTLGAASPDGRYLTYIDWETGDLALRDLRTGERRRLTKKGTWSSSSEFALYSILSPDGKQAAYNWFNKDSSWDLRVVGLDGSGPRILSSNKEVEEPDPVDWSPDGKYILARFSKLDRTNQIVLVSVADGSVRVLKTLDWRYPGKMSFSPDGRFIAYDFPPQQDSPSRDIFLLSTDGSREIPLVQHPANDLLLGWTPDGNRVLFASDRTGSMSVWDLEVVNGKPQGAPELLKADVGQIAALGFTRKGAFYYGVQIGRQDVYVATVDETTGKLLTAPNPVTQRYVGANSSPHWSPDGQYLAYSSQRGARQFRPGSSVIVIRSIKTGEEREIAPKLNYFGLGPWSLDGRSLLLGGTDTKGRQGIFRIDAGGASLTPVLLSEPGTQGLLAEWSPDGKAIFIGRHIKAAKSDSIVERDLETGREKELYRVSSPYWIPRPALSALSPDGRQLAFMLTDVLNQPYFLMVIPTSGGEPRKLLEVREPEFIGSITWTPDSHYIVFSKGGNKPQDPKDELWRIPAGGGVPEKLGLAMGWVRDLRFHPDGRRIAFTAGQDKSEVWVMENFLPVLKASR